MTKQTVFARFTAALAGKFAQRQWLKFQAATHRPQQTQLQVLMQLIRRNAASRFGRDHGFAHIRNYEDFRRQVPVSDYEYFRPYIERLKAGELSAMFGAGERLVMFALTSGTTGLPKYIPVTRTFLSSYRRGWNIWGLRALTEHKQAWLRKILQVVSPMDENRTAAGIPCGAITGLLAQTQKWIVRRHYALVPCVGRIGDADDRYYTIMRLAIPQDIAFISTANPSTVLKLAQTAECFAERLIDDIRTGRLNPPNGPLPAEMVQQLGHMLRPQPRTAEKLASLLNQHGALLPKHFWRLAFLANWTGGTLKLYLQRFGDYFADVPVRDIGLLASEGRISIPISDWTAAGILEIQGGFFEFVPEADYHSDKPDVLLAHELQEGERYFVLLSNGSGLYRYRLGDLVVVRGFYNATPMIEFLSKGRHISNLTGEKLTEHQVVEAFSQAMRKIEQQIDRFVLLPHWEMPPCYVLNIEAGQLSLSQQQALAADMDQTLQKLNIEYSAKRRSGRLGPVRLRTLQSGFWKRYEQDNIRRQRGRQEQYKHKYLLNNPDDERLFQAYQANHAQSAAELHR